MDLLRTLAATAFAFACGSLPFSYWIARRFLRKDLRGHADGNPGAWNVRRVGGTGWFVAALVLDVAKGWLPVWVSRQLLGVRGWDLVPVALAPVLGHAFSPFLSWKGGKGLASTLGVWLALTTWRLPLVALATLLPLVRVLRPSGWAVVCTMVTTGAALAWFWPKPAWLAVWAGHSLLLLWTHRRDLAQRPRVGNARAPIG